MYNIIAFKSCHINDIEGENAMRKRILSLLLAIIMTISLGVVAFADEAIVASGNCGAAAELGGAGARS